MWSRTVLALACVAGLAGTACLAGLGNVVQGSGRVESQSRQVSGFSEVELAAPGSVSLSQGDTEGLVISAEDNLLPLLTADVSDGRLRLRVKPGSDLRPTRPITYQVRLRQVRGLYISGSGRLQAAGLTATNLELAISGSGDARLDQLTADRLRVEISGSGGAAVSGQAPGEDVSISGSGSYDAGNLATRTATANISGSGDCRVRASESLGVTISGSGSVVYFGSPAVTQRVAGSGSVRRG